MGLFNNDNELRDSHGHLPNTAGRNIAALFALAAFVLSVGAFLYIVLFV